jgi:hypothetical protein
MKQIRLEALKLAVTHGLGPADTLQVSDQYFNYISTGPKIAQLPPQRRKRHQDSKNQDNLIG